jgi:hypothetical protein
MDEERIQHLQTTINHPNWADAILSEAGVTETYDRPEQIDFQTMIAILVFSEEELVSEEGPDWNQKQDTIKDELITAFRQIAGGRAVYFLPGRRFLALPVKRSPTQLLCHVPIVCRFLVVGGASVECFAQVTGLVQMLKDFEEYSIPALHR